MNEEKKRGKITPRVIVIGILLLVMIVSGVGLIRDQLASRKQLEDMESVARLATQTSSATENKVPESKTAEETTEAPYVSPINFEALWEENPETIGWLRIPGTNVDYPIVQAGDNEKYLGTDFCGVDSKYGAIYLDYESEPDFSGWNNPIYGHHMKDGSMFKDVIKFKDEAYFKEHQFFEIYTPERTIHLKAVSCYYTDSNGIVRKTKFKSQESFDAWVKERLEPCEFAEIPETSVSSMFVLVTCSYEINDARTLLYAVEVDENGDVVAAAR